MSQENVEVVRRSFEAVNRNDAEAMAALCTDDIEFASMLSAIEEASYRGREAWRNYFTDMAKTWGDWRAEDAEIFEADDRHLASVFRMVGRGKASGAPVEQRVGVAYTFRDGKISRMRSYLDPRKALEAVGLAE
jgi:ketosteroid isomerase-like protein